MDEWDGTTTLTRMSHSDDSDKNLSTAIVRVKKIDQWGRAYGSGGRKTATSRVWIKPGTGEFTVRTEEDDG